MTAQRTRKNLEEYEEMFESRISAGATEKTTRVGKTSGKHGSVVLRHGTGHAQKCVERYCEQESRAAVQQSFQSLLGWSSIQKGGA